METEKKELTERQQAFVEEFARNRFTNAKDAALKAGYSEETAANAYRAVLGSATVRDEIGRLKEALMTELQDRLLSEAEEAVKALVEIVRNGEAGYSPRIAAAREILDRCGIIRTERVEKIQGPVKILVTYEKGEEEGPDEEREEAR